MDGKLTDLGIGNTAVNPAGVPAMSGEKLCKADVVASDRLAREVRSGPLEGTYVPEIEIRIIRPLQMIKRIKKKRGRGVFFK